MQALLKKIAELLRLIHIDRRLKKLGAFIAVAVVFCTTYMLILPAITMENEVSCGFEEHTHTDTCYTFMEIGSGEDESGEKVFICELAEHTHSDNCYVSEDADLSALDEETRDFIQYVIDSIDALPDVEKIEAVIAEFEENEDYEGEAEYLAAISKQGYDCYSSYCVIEEYSEYITNVDKLYDTSAYWSAYTRGLNSDGSVSVNIYAVNSYTTSTSNYAPVIVYGGSASSLSVTDERGFYYWMGIVVECDSSGNYYVASVNTDYTSTGSTTKYNLSASSANGFVVFIWAGYGTEYEAALNNISAGDSVSVNFDYKTKTSDSNTVIGTVTFGGSVLEDKDNSEELHIVESADTYDLISINLYDYGSNINEMYTGNSEYPGFQQNGGTHTTFTSLSASMLNFGDSVTKDILAGTTSVTTSTASAINKMNTDNTANRPSENAMSYLLGDDGCPVLANGLSLGYLFTDGTYAKKQNTDNINGLFIQDTDTGLYHYNSHDNHAQFEADTNTFTLYKEVISPNYMMYPFGNFFPFADIVHDSKSSSDIDGTYLSLIANRSYSKYLNGEAVNDEYDEYLGLYNALTSFVRLMNTSYGTSWAAEDAVNYYFKQSGIKDSSGNYITFENDDLSDIYTLDYDVPSDFYFGMEMEMTFIQPKDGLTGTTGQEELVFYFTGDDDVWIYIDGVLFLDLSGIHRHVGGEIDFVNGKVYYYELLTTTGDVSDTPYKTETFEEILERAGASTDGLNDIGTFSDYTTHTLKFFYMERGSGSGVCRMNFNLPLVKDNTITITKEITVDEGNLDDILGDPYYSFQVFDAVDGEKTDVLYVDANTAFEVLDTTGNKIRDAVTDSNGIIKLKAGETAVITIEDSNVGEYYVREIIDEDFVAQYGQVIVDGSSVTTSIEGIYIGSDCFEGYESATKDILHGNTDFSFKNSIDSSELGAIKLTKELYGIPTDRSFTFIVTINDKLLPVDTPYVLISEDGTETEMTVTVEGEVSLKAGESVLIANILAGSFFEVTEGAESKESYILSYEEKSEYYYSDGDIAYGYILPASTVKPLVMTAINSEDGASVTIEGTKKLPFSDGNSHLYYISLQQVTSQSGEVLVDNGVQMQTPVEFSGSDDSLTQSFSFTLNYYDSILTTGETKYYYLIYEQYDESLADNTDFDTSSYVAEVTVTKTEDEITAMITALYKDGERVSEFSVDFENTLIGQITVSKEVIGGDENHYSADFEFELEFVYNDEPLSGAYVVEKTDSAAVVTSEELTVTDGKASVYIKHNESFTVKGIPIGTVVTVTEITQGYYTTYTLGGSDLLYDGNTCDIVVESGESTVKFFNGVSYVLPETGGTGTQLYIIGGLLTSLSAVFLLCYMKKCRERRLRSSRL